MLSGIFGVNGIRLSAAPRLRAAYLIRAHRWPGPTRRKILLASLGGAALLAALLFGEREPAARMLQSLRHHSLAATVIAALGGGVMSARRRALVRAEYTKSWLAALPLRAATARWESLIIEMAPALAAAAALAAFFLAAAAVLFFASGSGGMSALSVGAAMSGGMIGGAVASYAIPLPKPIDLPPGSRYVPHRRTGKASTLRPSLKALGVWPLRQMFARAQPTMVSRALMPVLIMMPLGSMADTAMVVVGLFLVSGALCLLIPGAVSVSAMARRWTAPLPVRAARVVRATVLPSLAVIAGLCAAAAGLLIVLRMSTP